MTVLSLLKLPPGKLETDDPNNLTEVVIDFKRNVSVQILRNADLECFDLIE